MSQAYSKYTIMGIDQSINSTGICIRIHKLYRGSTQIKTTSTYYNIVASTKMTKALENFSHSHISILKYTRMDGTDYESKERAKTYNIFAICNIIEKLIRKHHVNVVVLEGISYGSVGSASLVDLAGLNYCIRMTALNIGCTIRLASPMSVKKMATGNGGAEKEEMIWAWQNCEPSIKDIKLKKVDDLADSYFLARIYEQEYFKTLK